MLARDLLLMLKACLIILLLLVAGCSSRKAPAPVVDIKGQVPLSERVKHSIKGTEYIVKKGETLYSIAWRADLDVRGLAKLNNISTPYRIFPGQKLILKQNIAKASKHKPSRTKSNKYSGKTSTKVYKKPIAPKKKVGYGGTASDQKVSKKASGSQTKFSQKIRKWRWPAKGKVIATFSTAAKGNKGINIAGRYGENIIAAADGKVVYVGSALRGYGKLIIIKHNNDYLSAYAHNDKLLVSEQQQVKAGDVIATMGNSGAERVMLHFEVRFRGKSVNPMKYLPKK